MIAALAVMQLAHAEPLASELEGYWSGSKGTIEVDSDGVLVFFAGNSDAVVSYDAIRTADNDYAIRVSEVSGADPSLITGDLMVILVRGDKLSIAGAGPKIDGIYAR